MAKSGEEEPTAQRLLRITDVADEPLGFLAPISGYAEMPLVTIEKAVEPLISVVPNIQSQAYVAKERCKKPADDLTQDESAAIMLYTMGATPIEKSFYVILNNTLRSPDRQDTLKPWFLYLRLFLNALFRLPSLHETVFRGVKLDMSKGYTKGNKVVWWGFSSCTTVADVLQSEIFLGKTSVRTIFNIQCQTVRDICKHSYFPQENEVLLLAATQFEVISSLDQGDLRIIQLKETRPPHPLLEPVPIIGSQPNNSLSTGPKPVAVFKKVTTSVPSQPKSIYQDGELQQLMSKEKNSSEINLQRKKLIDEDIEAVAFYVSHANKTLTTLNLWNNQIGDKGVEHLSNALKNNKTFIIVNLSNNKIEADGAKHLSDALLHNTTLLELRLADNQIGPEGAKHFSDALKQNKSLATLNLWTNKIGDEGAKYISEALGQNTALTTLNLWNNQIGDQGAKYLSDALQHNKTLTTLDLARNQIRDQGAQSLSDALKRNKKLASLDISNNPIGEQGAKHLVELKKQNKILTIQCDKDLSSLMEKCVIS